MHLPSLTLLTTCLLLLGSDLVTLTESSNVLPDNEGQGSETGMAPVSPEFADPRRNLEMLIPESDYEWLLTVEPRQDVLGLRPWFSTRFDCKKIENDFCAPLRSIVLWVDSSAIKQKYGIDQNNDVKDVEQFYANVLTRVITFPEDVNNQQRPDGAKMCVVTLDGLVDAIDYALDTYQDTVNYAKGRCSPFKRAVVGLLRLVAELGKAFYKSQDFIGLATHAKKVCAKGGYHKEDETEMITIYYKMSSQLTKPRHPET